MKSEKTTRLSSPALFWLAQKRTRRLSLAAKTLVDLDIHLQHFTRPFRIHMQALVALPVPIAGETLMTSQTGEGPLSRVSSLVCL